MLMISKNESAFSATVSKALADELNALPEFPEKYPSLMFFIVFFLQFAETAQKTDFPFYGYMVK